MNASTMSLTFQATAFQVIQRANQVWLRMPEIASALYSKGGEQSDGTLGNAVRALQMLYQRHADEFTSAMTRLVNVQTNGGKQQVRIFSLRGCHLLAMFARTPVAKEFRRWVLDVLDAQIAGKNAEEKAKLPLPDGRWCVEVKRGQVVYQGSAEGCYFVRGSELASLVREPGEIPIEVLPSLIEAASERLKRWVPDQLRKVTRNPRTFSVIRAGMEVVV